MHDHLYNDCFKNTSVLRSLVDLQSLLEMLIFFTSKLLLFVPIFLLNHSTNVYIDKLNP